MRHYAKVLPQFWIGKTGKEIRELGLEAQVIAHYLISSPHSNMIGIYYLPIALISHETGIAYDVVQRTIQNLSKIKFCSYDEEMEYIWVHNMALYQIESQLKQNDHRVKNINTRYKQLPNVCFSEKFYEKYKTIFWLEAPSKTLLSQEQDQEQEQNQEITMSGKPDVVSFKNHFEKNLKQDAETILNFLNTKTNRAYRPVDANIKLIIARLKSGVSVTECRQVIAKKTREWKNNEKMSTYLRPATLFEATNFEQYLGELIEEITENEGGHNERVS